MPANAPVRSWGRWRLDLGRMDFLGRAAEPALVVVAVEAEELFAIPLSRLGEAHWVAAVRAKPWCSAEDAAALARALADLRAERERGATP